MDAKPIAIRDDETDSCTLLPDLFIDIHMPSANGEFVKVYIYLLQLVQKKRRDFSLSDAADVFACTEKDILRALLFWEKRGLMALDRMENTIAGVRFVRTAAPGAKTQDDPDGAEAPSASSDASLTLTNDRSRRLLTEDQNVPQICMIAESYLGRTLSTADLNRLLYLYDELGFSVDLIDYLIEYCVLKGKRSMHYIEKVGLEWYNDGVKTVPEAKARTNRWNRDYYTILRAFGQSNRDPVSKEITYMQRWLNTWGFPTELICEACERTVTQTGRASFEYADKILAAWRDAGVRTAADIEQLDRKHSEAAAQDTAAPAAGTGTDERTGRTARRRGNDSGTAARQNKFNNFKQRTYDFDALEQQLLHGEIKGHE